MMWAPGEEAVYVGGCEEKAASVCRCPTSCANPLNPQQVYLVREVMTDGECPWCGSKIGLRLFGETYKIDHGHCANDFRKPLVIEDEITIKVCEDV